MALKSDVPNTTESGGRDLWSGLEELAASPAFQEMLHREFPDDATAWSDPVTRRSFLTLAGASVALAGIGCSPRPASPEKIYPYTRQPEQITPGLPLFFATGYTLSGVTNGILVKSREGRPVKVEGNPSHPGSLGASDSFMQASLLNMYDPDRSRQALRQGAETSWENAFSDLRVALQKVKASGGSIRILSETIGSPTFGALMGDFLKVYPKAEWVQYEPLNRDNAVEGSKQVFGDVVNTIYDFTKAYRVVSLDSDFLCAGPGAVRYSKDFNSLRNTYLREEDHGDHSHVNVVKESEMNRLYIVESMLSPTGAVADHRLPLRSADVESFARALAKELGVAVGEGGQLSKLAKEWIAPLAKDLQANKGKSIVVAGDHQPAAVHAIAHAINAALGNVGKTVFYTAPTEVKASNQTADYKKLVKEMADGKVAALFILSVNPVYTSPADIDFVAALSKVPLKVHVGQYVDETAVLCDWHLNEAHSLESWGDGRGYDGTATIIQPLIAPLFNGHSPLELIAALTGESIDVTARELVKNYWSKNWPTAKEKNDSSFDFADAWQKALRDGVIPGSALPKVDKKANASGITAYKAAAPGVEVNFRADPTLYDGRFANNGWLQELPKPITKLTWDNAAIMCRKLANENKILNYIESTGGGEHGRTTATLADLKVGGRSARVGGWIQPMHVEDSITIYLGHGRERAGKVGNGTGFNAYKLRSSDNPWVSVGGELAATSSTMILACVQSHHQMENRRPVRAASREIFEKNYEAHLKDPEKVALFAKVATIAAPEWHAIDELIPGREHAGHDHHHEESEGGKKHTHDKRITPLSMYPNTNKEGRQWAMSIDLTGCNGCGVCQIACMAENNISVVGKKEVTRGREMHWIRIDRYFEGNDPDDAANLVAHHQPVACVQCEKAPCEVVCPVAATLHSADGLNDMVYNRCVGTRYCSNNCPYKVRRFNFLTFADWKTDTLKLMRNPEVTVRERGVMEKCTYCVQRIRAAEVEAERQGRRIYDGEIVTACEAACPSSCIVFGDLNDPKARINQAKKQPHMYGLLSELNTLPRTTYLAAIRNPNPEMPKKVV
jgi:MoCo/4Fe-4S cofactor protein with predicted Tat translocation signal